MRSIDSFNWGLWINGGMVGYLLGSWDLPDFVNGSILLAIVGISIVQIAGWFDR